MSETSQQKGAEGENQAASVKKVESIKADVIQDDQRDSRKDAIKPMESDAVTDATGVIKVTEEPKAATTNTVAKQDTPLAMTIPITPQERMEPATVPTVEPQPPAGTKQDAPSSSPQCMEDANKTTARSNEKLDNPQVAMLASLKITKDELGQACATTDSNKQEKQPAAKGKELKCKSCALCKDERVPAAIFQPMEGNKSVAIKFSPQCGHACTIVINNAFEITEHVCTSYVEREESKENLSDFDFDRFISGGEDLDDFLLKQKTRQAGKLVTLEDQMKVAVKKLVKPLAVLVPTAVQKKSEAQLRAEREDRLRQVVEIEANMVYLRVLEFEKAAVGNMAYPIDKLSKMLKDLDKKYITGFIQKVNNDFLISYSEQAQTVRFYNPSKPEVEILSREFEKWLRFNRL